MNFSVAVKTCLLKYADFEGRASRSEYWYFLFFDIAVFLVATTLARLFSDWFIVLAALGLMPLWAVHARRHHDVGSSAWALRWNWLYLIERGTVGPNRYGPDPLQTLPPPCAP
jgi:uncharacterized membrane protein YhaH (DUF805 family)